MKKIGVISAILEAPEESQSDFNRIISDYKELVKGRMGIPFDDENISVVTITVVGDINDINSLTGKLGNLPHVQVKTSISKRDII